MLDDLRQIGRGEHMIGIGLECGRIDEDGRAWEVHRERDLRLGEAAHAIGHHRDQQEQQEPAGERDRKQAHEPEAALGGIAALDADIAAWRGGRRNRHGDGGNNIRHSYCSRYLRTI